MAQELFDHARWRRSHLCVARAGFPGCCGDRCGKRLAASTGEEKINKDDGQTKKIQRTRIRPLTRDMVDLAVRHIKVENITTTSENSLLKHNESMQKRKIDAKTRLAQRISSRKKKKTSRV